MEKKADVGLHGGRIELVLAELAMDESGTYMLSIPYQSITSSLPRYSPYKNVPMTGKLRLSPAITVGSARPNL